MLDSFRGGGVVLDGVVLLVVVLLVVRAVVEVVPTGAGTVGGIVLREICTVCCLQVPSV